MVEQQRHRLAALLEDAARGRFPAADGTVEIMPAPPGRAMAVVAFTGRHVVAASAQESWVRERLRDGDLLAPMGPRFLTELAEQLGRRADTIDVVLAASGLEGDAALVEVAREAHPRVVRANANREDVRTFEDPGGAAVVILGRGLALRTEVAIDVDAAHRGRGVARRALVEARRLLAPDELVFAQTAPGNAASLRALLAAGFRPICGEMLFFAGAAPPE
jgi:GNAT superfamily N-acetyltransferase